MLRQLQRKINYEKKVIFHNQTDAYKSQVSAAKLRRR